MTLSHHPPLNMEEMRVKSGGDVRALSNKARWG